jgi:AAA+ ATPase superfamily predicted ATPase
MRKFNCTGPCYPDEHYYIRRDEVMEKVKEMIDEGAYFVVYAPRQMGKTTLLENMLFELERENPDFIGILVDFEIYKSQTPEAFYENFSEKLTEQLLKRCQEINLQKADELIKHLASLSVQDVLGFEKYVRTITRIIPEYRLSIVIDEFEGCPDEAMKDFLHILRSFYLSKKRNKNLRNLNFVLIGIRDLTKLTVGTISPFNIAQHLYLENFSMQEVIQLYRQYTQETGQLFSDEAVSFIYEQTGGQPFLVNRLGVILTEEMNIDNRETITLQHAKEALRKILCETNNNFKTMLIHAQENREAILKIIAGWQLTYDEDNPLVTDLWNYGLIREEGGVCVVNNPIYQSKILSAFRPTRNEIDQLWQSIEFLFFSF